MRPFFFVALALTACEDLVKSDGSQSSYECFLTVTGTDNENGLQENLVESSYELICATESDKNSQMDDNCNISESNYTEDYTDLSCDWECIETSTCD